MLPKKLTFTIHMYQKQNRTFQFHFIDGLLLGNYSLRLILVVNDLVKVYTKSVITNMILVVVIFMPS
jgi:hypothetical protein